MEQETLTPQCEMRLERPSRTRKALVSVLGGLGIFAGVQAFGIYADTKANEQEYAEAQNSNTLDLAEAKAKSVPRIDVRGKLNKVLENNE